MIKAKYWQENGREITVEIWSADKAAGIATVSNFNYIGTGCWWDFAPRFQVAIDELRDIVQVCPDCGQDFDPAGPGCECGRNWRELISDEQDSEQTRRDLAGVYYGG